MNEILEVWRPTGLGEGIEVSNKGNVRGAAPFYHQGYIDISHKGKDYRVHILVARAFPEICGEWFDGCEVHHLNGNKSDNRAENLRVMTKGEHRIFHNKGKSLSYETRKKLSEANRGRHPSEETRKKMGIAHRRENLSSDTIKKISDANKKKVFQYNLSNELINIFSSINEAAHFTNSNPSAISMCCNNKIKSSNGFKWSFIPF